MIDGKIIVKQSNIHGKGIFAREEIRKGEVVFLLEGKLHRGHEYDDEEPNLKAAQSWIQLDIDIWLESPRARYLNHSCNPNVAIVEQKTIALRNIEREEEVFYDYGTSEWDECPCRWTFACKCNSDNCRKVINGYKHLPEVVKERYKSLSIIPQHILQLEKLYSHELQRKNKTAI